MTSRQQALINRQKDKGWGYAIAHLFPFVPVYYAWKRRTLTPLAYAILTNLVIVLVYSDVLTPKTREKEGIADLILSAIFTPIVVKEGIRSARNESNASFYK